MNEGIKRRWCQALRSGRYPRNKVSMLRSYDVGGEIFSYSPIGVLADLLEYGRFHASSFVFREEEKLVHIHDALEIKMDLKIFIQGEILSLHLHDRYDFAEVADYIEENL